MWATSRKGQPDADLHSVENSEHALIRDKEEWTVRCQLTPCSKPEHALVSNKQEGSARCWLTHCSKSRACSCQQQTGRASQFLTYLLFNPKHILVSDKQEGPTRCWLTSCSKHRAYSCQQQSGIASQMLTYILFKTQRMLLSARSKKGQPDADLHAVQNPEHPFLSNKEKGTARCWLTSCSKPRARSCQQQGGRAT